MAPVLKFATSSGAVGAGVAIGFYLLSVVIGIFPIWLLMPYLVLCPPGLLFMATAACETWDSCSLQALSIVALSNAVLYFLAGIVIYVVVSLVKRRSVRTGPSDAA